MFVERASLVQDYDVGETGRFGNQIRSLPLLLDRFSGFGPLQFRNDFIEDPHETYLNAFASYGWIGGLSYLAFTAVALFVGWRLDVAKRAVPNRSDRRLVVLVRPDGPGPSDRHRPLASPVPAIRPHFRTCRRRPDRPAPSRGRRRRSPTNAARPSRGPFAQGLAARRSLGGDGVGVAREPAPVARLGQCAQSVVGLPQARANVGNSGPPRTARLTPGGNRRGAARARRRRARRCTAHIGREILGIRRRGDRRRKSVRPER